MVLFWSCLMSVSNMMKTTVWKLWISPLCKNKVVKWQWVETKTVVNSAPATSRTKCNDISTPNWKAWFPIWSHLKLWNSETKLQTWQGWAGIPVSRDSREYKPQISLPFPWHFVISLPVPGKRKFWPGIKTGNTIIIFSFADGWSRHENKSNLEFNLAFYMIPGISRDSRDNKPQISHSLPFPWHFLIPVPFP